MKSLSQKEKMRGFWALFVSAFFYATFGSLIKELSTTFGTFSQVVIRCAITFLLAMIVVFYKKYPKKLPKANIFLLILFCIVPIFSIMSLTYTITLVSATNAIFYLYAGYIFTTNLIGKIVYKEKLTIGKIIAFIIAVVGIFFFAYPFKSVNILGMFFGVLAGAIDGVSSGICKNFGKLNSTVLIWYRYGIGAVLSSFFLLGAHEHLLGSITIYTVLTAFALGLFLLIIDSLWLYGFSHFDVNTGSVVTAAELCIAPILNAIFWREYPTTLEYIGGLCIMSAVILINIQINRKEAT